MITIGRIAEKYGMLPSQVVLNATTYDYMIMDVLQTLEAYQMQQSTGNLDPSIYDLSEDQMQDMLEKAREQHH